MTKFNILTFLYSIHKSYRYLLSRWFDGLLIDMLFKICRPATLVSSRYEEMSRELAPPKLSMEPCMDNMLLLLTKLALLFVSVLFVQQMSNIK